MALNLKQRAAGFLQQHQKESPATYAAAEQAIGAVLIADGIFGINNPLGGNKRPGIFGTLVGMVVGVIFMLVPNFIGRLTNYDAMTATTAATVVAVGTSSSNSNSSNSCSLKVRYVVADKEYAQQSATSASSYCSLTEGQTVTINYDPASPGSWAYDIKTIGGFIKIFFWVGLLALISSIVTFFIRLLSIIYGWKLLQDGRRNAANLPEGTNIQTMIDEIKHSFATSVFGAGRGTPAPQASVPPENIVPPLK